MPEKNNDNQPTRVLVTDEQISSTLAEIVQINKDSVAASTADFAEIREVLKKTETTLSEIADMQREARATAKVEWAEIRELSRKNEAAIAELARFSKDLGKEVGGNTNKFGSYTESLAAPSIRRILDEHFDAEYIGDLKYSGKKGSVGTLQVDGFGLARNGVDAVYLVEIKSKFRPRHIRQIWRQVELFRYYSYPHGNYLVFPILAVVEVSEAHRQQIWEQGIHVIDVADGVFSLSRPPKEFQANGNHGLKMHRRALPPMRLVWDAESA